jgi:hypothetical protein
MLPKATPGKISYDWCIRFEGEQPSANGCIKPCPSPEVEFCLRENYRSQAGLGIVLKTNSFLEKTGS